MKKRIGAVLLAVCLALTLVPTAWAEGNAVAELLEEDGTKTTYSSVEELLAGTDNCNIRYEQTLRLLDDISLPYNDGCAISLYYCTTLDLNGKTLTITGSPADGLFLGIWSVYGNTIKNGRILISASNVNDEDLALAICRYGGGLDLYGVEIAVADGVNLTAAIGVTSDQEEGNVTLTNCTVDAGGGRAISIIDDIWKVENSDVIVTSGSYKNLYNETGTLPEHTETSPVLQTPLPGLDEGTTVITSPDTTAIIVKDGNAYLYDSLQDAVDAAKDKQGGAGGAVQISLLKQPEDATVVLPDGVELTIKPLDDADDSIKTEDIQLETSDGKKAEIGTNGEVMVQAVPVQSVTLNKPTLSLAVGGSEALAATVLPADAADKNVTWASSDVNIATVDAAGVVTAVAEGTAAITATAGGKTASCVVTVSPAAIPVTGVTLDKPALALAVGERGTLTATVSPENATDKTVAWFSDNGAVATVDQNGVVTAVSAGTAQITATAGGQSASCTVTVTFPYIPVIPTQPTQPTKPTQPDTPDEPDTPDIPASGYADVSANDWFYDEVAYVTAKGLMTGTTATTFAPSATTTRAMVWTILGRMTGAKVDGGEPWYSLAQTWAMSSGVSDGTNPNGSITREELAVMLYRYAGSPAVGLSELAKLGQFTDGETVSDWAQEAMAWAVSNGVISGSGSALNPQASATRAQVAAMLMRLDGNLKK